MSKPTPFHHIPGIGDYRPPTAQEVTAQQLHTLIEQNKVIASLLECVFRATLGQTEEDIEGATGVRLMTREEMDELRAEVGADIDAERAGGAGPADS